MTKAEQFSKKYYSLLLWASDQKQEFLIKKETDLKRSFEKSLKEYAEAYYEEKMEEYEEPYFGWCNVDGCENEGCNGGGCWRETGYWTVCSKHSKQWREGKPQPKMKQSAIDKEKTRDKKTGYLPIN